MKSNIKTSWNKLFILCSLFFVLLANAQSNNSFYVRVNTGYAYGTGTSSYDQSKNSFHLINIDVTNISTPKLNLGDGFKAGLTVGYEVDKHIAVELGADYLWSNTIHTNRTYQSSYYKNDLKSNMLQLKPTLVLKAGFEKINPYTKIGMLIGTGKITKEENSKYRLNLTDTYGNSTLELTGGIPIGFTASIGSTYKINDKIMLFGELNLQRLTYAPQKGKYTKYVVNGVDKLPTMTISEKEFEFVNTISEDEPIVNSQPSKMWNMPFSYNSIGINIGMQYHF